jgi:hypothetical protein
MVPVSAVRRLKMTAGKRAFKMLADQAIGHDLLKGLLELITNSDESYAVLELAGARPSGRIEIEVDRRTRTKQTVIRVIDWAEGMDEAQLEKCLVGYGEDTSAHVGRGVFGMGLKDTIVAFGEGTITSFKNEKKYRCSHTNVDDLALEPAQAVTRSDKKEFRNTTGGTIVEIAVRNPEIRIPQMDSLRRQLQMHVCLRGIMTDPTRTLVLRDLRSGSADDLRYETPENELLVDRAELSLASYPEIRPKLTVRRAVGADALSQSGSDRTGGILVVSRRTCHEATLFGFDDDPHAARLFGELRCDEIYDKQAGGDWIVDKNRDGLKKNHPLTKELFQAARQVIDGIIAEERKEEREKQRKLENEKTLRRFREAIKSLNEIARRELQLGGPGTGVGPGTPTDPRAPQDGFEFIPDTYRIIISERELLKLRVQVDGTTGIAVGDKIEISCDNPKIKVLDNAPSVPKLFHEDPPLSIVHVPVEGLQANAQGFITAKYNGKTAIAAVEVVSTKAQTQHHATGGLFKAISYEQKPSWPHRARFDKKECVIWINTLGPSVDLYFGPSGEGQDLPANQVLVAELVTELACQEIARRKKEAKLLDIPPGVDELDAYSLHITKLKADYAPILHKALVGMENRRK